MTTDPDRDFKRGVLAASSVADDYNGSTTHPNRLGDCIAAKLNCRRERVRRNRSRLQSPDDAWTCGLALGLAEVHRLLGGGNNSSSVREIARNAGLTIARAKAAGVDPYDWRELKKAGVP